MLSSTEYLDATLLPLIEGIKPKTTDSFILEACGLSSRPSTQSISIQMGGLLEKFWNQVFSDMNSNMIEDSDRIKVNGRERQVDHFISIPNHELIQYYYLESKCNVNFDTEKVRASNQKIHDVAAALAEGLVGQNALLKSNVERGYFVPVKRDIPIEVSREFTNEGVHIFGVSDLYRWFDNELPFTIDEYFDFFKTRLAPIIEALLDGVTVGQPAQRGRHSRLDAL
jgi:hypothetical protein